MFCAPKHVAEHNRIRDEIKSHGYPDVPFIPIIQPDSDEHKKCSYFRGIKLMTQNDLTIGKNSRSSSKRSFPENLPSFKVREGWLKRLMLPLDSVIIQRMIISIPNILLSPPEVFKSWQSTEHKLSYKNLWPDDAFRNDIIMNPSEVPAAVIKGSNPFRDPYAWLKWLPKAREIQEKINQRDKDQKDRRIYIKHGHKVLEDKRQELKNDLIKLTTPQIIQRFPQLKQEPRVHLNRINVIRCKDCDALVQFLSMYTHVCRSKGDPNIWWLDHNNTQSHHEYIIPDDNDSGGHECPAEEEMEVSGTSCDRMTPDEINDYDELSSDDQLISKSYMDYDEDDILGQILMESELITQSEEYN